MTRLTLGHRHVLAPHLHGDRAVEALRGKRVLGRRDGLVVTLADKIESERVSGLADMGQRLRGLLSLSTTNPCIPASPSVTQILVVFETPMSSTCGSSSRLLTSIRR